MGACTHKRIKRNYPFGKKSFPSMKCKNCGKPIKPKILEVERKRKEYIRKKNYEN
jgi:hypothetical protein